ncbi:MAG: putative DNA binding domain-containing protein, partial [Oligoflexia bacterium]|nr:putative DNA binding domain-containing protein [Oligoflexia bacterium]
MSKINLSKDLKSILKKGEDHKTEFKEEVYKKLDREIVAFANASGGKIYIGITNEGKIKGINITSRLKGQIENIAKNCDPKISISFQEIKKEKVLIVEIEESKKKPHRCSSGYYIRSGSTSQKLKSEEIRDFMEEEDLLNFDKVPCKEFDFKKDFDKEKLFSFMDRTGIKYSRKNY